MSDIKKVIKEVLSKSKNKEDWGAPVASYKLTFDSQQAQLEPIYYWILDFIQDTGWETKKITDNFMSSPGSGHFAEMGQRATKMQEEGMKILGGINQIVKSILNLIYDLKEFEIRLESYNDANSENKQKNSDGNLALKQIWLDNVDLKRGRGSIHQMATELGFATIREAFMMADSRESLTKMNEDLGGGIINDQVFRILIPRINEFKKWKEYSEKELRKRMSIEKNYLKSQVETIKLYSGWIKPYLKSAEELRQKGFEGDSALVNAFSTSMFELTLLAKKNSKVPEKFGEYNLKRRYNPCMIITLKYRGHVSQRVTQKGDQGFAMGGRIDMTFDSYSLNEEELKLIEEELKKEDVTDSMNYQGDVAEEALKELKEDLDKFLNNKEDKKELIKTEDINPFTAIFSLFKKSEQKLKTEKNEIKNISEIKPDNFIEKAIRAEGAETAANGSYSVYDIYKKSHGMASSPTAFDNADLKKTEEPETQFKDIFKGQDKN
jgi:hypothetical protein